MTTKEVWKNNAMAIVMVLNASKDKYKLWTQEELLKAVQRYVPPMRRLTTLQFTRAFTKQKEYMVFKRKYTGVPQFMFIKKEE